jgi:hypothetical protein
MHYFRWSITRLQALIAYLLNSIKNVGVVKYDIMDLFREFYEGTLNVDSVGDSPSGPLKQ